MASSTYTLSPLKPYRNVNVVPVNTAVDQLEILVSAMTCTLPANLVDLNLSSNYTLTPSLQKTPTTITGMIASSDTLASNDLTVVRGMNTALVVGGQFCFIPTYSTKAFNPFRVE